MKVLGHSLVHSLVRSHHSLVRSLAHFAHSLARGTVNDWMAILSVFFFLLSTIVLSSSSSSLRLRPFSLSHDLPGLLEDKELCHVTPPESADDNLRPEKKKLRRLTPRKAQQLQQPEQLQPPS